MRIALVYDCLYPYTTGGAERWYRSLAEELARRHQVTYLTRRQWKRGDQPDAPRGVNVIAFGAGRDLYDHAGRRRVGPPLRFGLAIFCHLLRGRYRYDVVHVCSFPYFPLIAAAIARRAGGPPFVADWAEVWERDYWRSYAGTLRGWIGAGIQGACARIRAPALAFSPMVARAVMDAGGATVQPIPGMMVAPLAAVCAQREPLVVFAGRHIREKHVSAIPAAIALARKELPGLRGALFGDGPERAKVLAEIRRLGLGEIISCPGFVAWDEVARALSRALCLVLPSEREGYGMVVAEAAAYGTPAVVLDSRASAAACLATEIGGVLINSAEPGAIAAGIVDTHARSRALAARASEWFRTHQARIGPAAALDIIDHAYAKVIAER